MKVIDDSVRRHGYSPSLREIGDAVGLASTSSVSHQVLKLQKLGLVSREPGRPRTILVRPSNEPAIRDQDGQEPDSADGNALAYVRYAGGRIAAGGPILAEESAAVNVRRLGRSGLLLLTRPSCPLSTAWSASVIVTVSVVLSRPAKPQKNSYVPGVTQV